MRDKDGDGIAAIFFLFSVFMTLYCFDINVGFFWAAMAIFLFIIKVIDE